MRFSFDPVKSQLLRSNPQRGVGFEEAQQLFALSFYSDHRSDLPEQYRAIGRIKGKLYSVIYEVREDEAGEFLWLVTLWKATPEERQLYVDQS